MTTEDPISLHEAAERLGVHYMTAYRYVRTGRLPGVLVNGQWRIDPRDLPSVGRSVGQPGRPPNGTRPQRPELRRRLEERLVDGDEAGAWAILEAAFGAGAGPDEAVLDLLAPALCAIGDRWAAGELTVGDEHQATAVAYRLLGRLGPRFVRRGPKRGTVVVGAPVGERHGIPVAMAADLLRAHGFRVVDLGADTPAQSFVEAASRASRPVAVGIGVTAKGRDRAVKETVRALVASLPDLPVLVGGAAVATAAHAERLGARWSGTGGADLVRAVEDARGAS